jgi:hypothetical protein
LAIVAIACSSSVAAQAGDRGFSVSGGMSRRRIEASFGMEAPAWDTIGTSYQRKQNVGELGLATEDRVMACYPSCPKVIQYADGRVVLADPFYLNWAGIGAIVDNNDKQIGVDPTAHTFLGQVRTVNFHSYEYSYSSEVVAGDGNARDSKTVDSPYIAFKYGDWGLAGGDASVNLRYTPMHAQLASGTRLLGVRTDRETTTTHTYTYDVGEAPMNEFRNIPALAPTVPNDWIIIYDAARFNRFPAALFTRERLNDPTESMSSSTAIVEARAVDGSSALDVYVHEIALSGRWTKTIASRVRLGFEAGPTLNVFHSRLDHSRQLLDATVGTTVSSSSETATSTKLKLGAMADATGSLLFDKKGRFFLEAAAGFHWVDGFGSSTSSASATAKTDDFAASIGVGFTL